MSAAKSNRLRGALAVALVAIVTAIAVTATSIASGLSNEPAWKKALIARSEALNRYYGLGEYAGKRTKSVVRVAVPQWKKALMARSDALNRIHGLGKYADR